MKFGIMAPYQMAPLEEGEYAVAFARLAEPWTWRTISRSPLSKTEYPVPDGTRCLPVWRETPAGLWMFLKSVV